MLFGVGVPGLKRTLSACVVSILISVGLVSCSSYNAPNNTRSGLKFRAFVSNPLHPGSSGGGVPVLEIIDASKDVLSPTAVSLIGAEPDAGFMVESPKRDRTLVFSPSNNGLAIVDNAQESVASTMTLPGTTESMFVWTDNTTAFVAVPSAPNPGQAAGGVGRINLSIPAITATIPIPGAHYLIPSPNGNQVLVISDSANAVMVLSPALIDSGSPLTPVSPPVSAPFDKPVWAVFSSDGSTAYVMNCGPECGGSVASISVIDMTQSPPTVSPTPIIVPAATTGLLSGSTLYVAGTPPPAAGTDCTANLCGVLTVFSSGSLTSLPTELPITDGYHNRIAMGANGQLFIGSHTCTNVIASGSTPVRGCLSIYNAAAGKVVTPAANGDTTGIEAITNRNVVYVVEGGKVAIYDTTTDQPQTTQVSVIGQPIDVKLADF